MMLNFEGCNPTQKPSFLLGGAPCSGLLFETMVSNETCRHQPMPYVEDNYRTDGSTYNATKLAWPKYAGFHSHRSSKKRPR